MNELDLRQRETGWLGFLHSGGRELCRQLILFFVAYVLPHPCRTKLTGKKEVASWMSSGFGMTTPVCLKIQKRLWNSMSLVVQKTPEPLI